MFNNCDSRTNGEYTFFMNIKDKIDCIFDVGCRSDSEFVNFTGEVHYFDPVSEFIEELSKVLPKDHHVITSDGSANVVTMQVLDLSGDQRLITNTGCAPMGYGLPAALGGSIHHKIIS